MSDLEKWFKRRLKTSVEPEWQYDQLDILEAVREEGESLARWLLKTAIVFERACPRGSLDKVNTKLFPIAAGKAPLGEYHVWAGYITQTRVLVRLCRGFPVWNGGVLHQHQIHPESLDFAIQLNHLVLRLVRCPQAQIGFKLSLTLYDGRRVVPLVLSSNSKFPFPAVYCFPTFEAFIETLEIYA